jgi:hypothetical protein
MIVAPWDFPEVTVQCFSIPVETRSDIGIASTCSTVMSREFLRGSTKVNSHEKYLGRIHHRGKYDGFNY